MQAVFSQQGAKQQFAGKNRVSLRPPLLVVEAQTVANAPIPSLLHTIHQRIRGIADAEGGSGLVIAKMQNKQNKEMHPSLPITFPGLNLNQSDTSSPLEAKQTLSGKKIDRSQSTDTTNNNRVNQCSHNAHDQQKAASHSLRHHEEIPSMNTPAFRDY
jgi:hypothetical protein